MDDKLKTDSVLDVSYLLNVLIELQLTLRKLSLYSVSHTLGPTLIENIEKHFNIVFEFVDEITLGITRNEFIYQGSNISSTNLVIRQLAKRLNQLGIASITFIKGLTKQEIFSFLKIIIESGKIIQERRNEAFFKFNQDTQYVRLKLIRFGDALKRSQESIRQPEHQVDNQDRKGIWRKLVADLMSDGNSDAIVEASGLETAENADTSDLAALINRLCEQGRDETKSYERTIVKYLNDQENKQNLSPEERIQFNKELSILLTRLEPEVRQQIFRISMEDMGREKGPLEEVLPFFSEPLLLEVFNQIHLSNKNISAPMVSLLNKFSELSAQDNRLGEQLTSNLENEKDIFRELLTNKADRAFYPSLYRTQLDQDLVQKIDEKGLFSEIQTAAVEPTAVNYHLALIVLELLEAPLCSQSEFSELVNIMIRLLKDGLGNESQELLQNFIFIIFQKLETATPENRNFFEEKIRELIGPEFLASFLQSLRISGDERLNRLFEYMNEIAGSELIRLLLDQLEVEENMSARKYLLQQITRCGKAVIPQAVARLNSPKWFVVRNMLVLLKDLKAREGLPEIQRYFMQAKSSKVKLAALQVLETIALGTDFFYKAMSVALSDNDPGIIRHAVSTILSNHDPKAMEVLKTVLMDLSQKQNALIIIQSVKKSNAVDFIPVLEKLRRRLRIRFWLSGHVRTLLKTVNETVAVLSSNR